MRVNMGFCKSIILQKNWGTSPAKDKTNKQKTPKQNKSERAAKLEWEQETAMFCEEH